MGQTDFTGAYEHSFDDKGRVLLPASFRAQIPGKVILSCGPDGAVVVQPAEVWAEMASRVRSTLPENGTPALRRMLGSHFEGQPDAGSRLTVPEFLRTFAGINAPSKALLVGVGSCFEIWDRAAFAEYARGAFRSDTLRAEAATAGVSELA